MATPGVHNWNTFTSGATIAAGHTASIVSNAAIP